MTLLLLVLTSLTILTLDFRHSGPVEKVRDVGATVFSPLRSAGDAVFRPIGNAWNSAFHYDRLKKENDRLRRQVADLKGKSYRAQIDENEYRQLRAAADIQYLPDLDTKIARVTSGPLNSFSQTIEINQGAGAGVKPGMPVVTPDGLVGTVEIVEGGHSIVRLVTSPESKVDITLETSDASLPPTLGIAHGNGLGQPLRIDSGIDPRTPVKKGQLVATSGVDPSIYPGAIPVGKITTFRDSDDGTQKIIELKPSADLDHLGYVTVVLWQPVP
ncbi:MAG TPA: rod shape-determining protein MreC [Acidimicrobiales bacterium]|nr:rod shape-determining protein MreC [Acidimicrobiales bacterium]